MSNGAVIRMKEIGADMRAHGVKISQEQLYQMAKERRFPWVADVTVSPHGRAYILVFRRDYEKWAEEYLRPYGEGAGV